MEWLAFVWLRVLFPSPEVRGRAYLLLLVPGAAFGAAFCLISLASLPWWRCQGLGGHTPKDMFKSMLLRASRFHFNYCSRLQPDFFWNNLCWNANLLLEVWPGNPSLSGVPLLGAGLAFVPRVGREPGSRAGSLGKLPAQIWRLTLVVSRCPLTSAGSVLRDSLWGWDFWALLFDFYFLMRLFEVNAWIKFLVLCVGKN